MALQIPERHQQAISLFLNASEQQISDLLRSLEVAKPSLTVSELAKQVAPNTGFSEDEIEGMLAALSGLYVLIPGHGTPDSLSEEFVQALQNLQTDDLFQGIDKKTAKARVRRILELEGAFAVTAKALDVMREHANRFCVGRILTDVRPVFYSDPTRAPAATVIVHTLKIRYHEGERSEPAGEFYVALDHKDLDDLIKVLERAREKENVVKALLREGVPILEVD